MDIKEYIQEELDFSGGGCWSTNTLGLVQVDYCFKECKIKIFWVNVKLFILWILKEY